MRMIIYLLNYYLIINWYRVMFLVGKHAESKEKKTTIKSLDG